MTEVPDWYTRVYLPGGKVTHLLSGNSSISISDPAACGIQPGVFFFWHGTGTYQEREKARTRPLCKKCLKEIV